MSEQNKYTDKGFTQEDYDKADLPSKLEFAVLADLSELTRTGNNSTAMYLIDKEDEIYSVEVETLEKIDMSLMRKALTKKIEEFEKSNNTTITGAVRVAPYLLNESKLDNLDLDEFDESGKTSETIAVTIESRLSTDVIFFDFIRDIKDPKNNLVSPDPIRTEKYVKIDPDRRLSGVFTNLIN